MAENWEDELAKEDAKSMKESYERLQRGQMLLQQEQLAQANNQAYAEGIREALKDMGLSEQEFGALYQANPELAIGTTKAVAKKFGKKLIEKAQKKHGVVRDAKSGKYVKAQPGVQASAKSKDGLAGIAESRREGKLNSDQALEKMVGTVLQDFFLETMGKR